MSQNSTAAIISTAITHSKKMVSITCMGTQRPPKFISASPLFTYIRFAVWRMAYVAYPWHESVTAQMRYPFAATTAIAK